MRLAKPVTIENDNGTISGNINSLPVDGCVYIIVPIPPEYGEDVSFTHEVPVDDLDTFSQKIIYHLVRRAREKNHGN